MFRASFGLPRTIHGRPRLVQVRGRDFYKMSLGKASSESHIYEAALEDSYIVLGWGSDEDWSDPKYERWQDTAFADWRPPYYTNKVG
jgi:hypothetical protein